MSKRIRLNDNHLPWEMKAEDASVGDAPAAEDRADRTESQRASSRMRYLPRYHLLGFTVDYSC